MKEKTIYDLDLHEGIVVNSMWVTRVPGGWLYDCWDCQQDMPKTGVFVPFHNEFMEMDK